MPLFRRKPLTVYEQRDHHEKIGRIGISNHADIWLCKRERDGKLMVQKISRSWTESNLVDGYPQEVIVLSRVIPTHDRILFVDYWAYGPNLELRTYYPYCEGGDMDQFDPGEGCGQPEMFVWHVFLQMADALALIHHGYDRKRTHKRPSLWRPIVHRDIKPENIFLRTRFNGRHDQAPNLVLGDFELATPNLRTTSGCGTPLWQGPEYPLVTPATDIWGLGAIVHWLCHGRPPLRSPPKGVRLEEWDKARDARDPRPLGKSYSRVLNECMMDCLELNPIYRINSRELVSQVVRGREAYAEYMERARREAREAEDRARRKAEVHAARREEAAARAHREAEAHARKVARDQRDAQAYQEAMFRRSSRGASHKSQRSYRRTSRKSNYRYGY